MVNEIIRYRIEPERAGEFLRACSEAEKTLRETGHCVRYDLARCAEAPEDYLLMIGWDTPDRRLQASRLSRQLGAFHRFVQPFSANVLETGCYERVPLDCAELGQ